MAHAEQSYGNLEHFGGFEIVQWAPGQPLGDPATQIHRLSTDYDGDQSWPALLAEYLRQPGAERMQGLVVGYWGTDTLMDADIQAEMAEPLRAAAAQLTQVRVLYINDISSEESEVSWISNTDLSALVQAFPGLTDLGIRGGNDLELPGLALPHLRTLVIEAGGLSSALVRQVVQADLPALTHLELWLGTEDYGATNSVEDLSPLLEGLRFPALRYLGLKNSDHQDQVVQVFSSAPVVGSLEVLDLSMGVLTDEGAQALVDNPGLSHLKKLDLQFNWLSEEMAGRLQAWADAHGIELDVSDRQDDEDEWRYVALGE